MTAHPHRKHDLTVQGSTMETLIFKPDGSGPFPAIIVAQHLPVAHAGLERDPFTLDVGEKLAAAGYVAVIPFLFHWWPAEQDMMEKVKAWRDDWNIADLDATFALTSSLQNVDVERIGILGHCWGGRVAWMAACTNPKYAAAAMFYGGRIKIGLGPDAEPAIDMADRIECPVLGVFGNEDQNPSPEDVAEIGQALTDANIEHEFHQFDGAGHGFQDFSNDDRYRPTQAAEAWTTFFEFMNRQLK
jgi:carboxymethylenebutenolidase